MSIMSSATTNSNPAMLNLEVSSPDGYVFQHELRQEHVLIVGSSSACGLRLESRDISGMHCSLEASEAGIKIRDWSSAGGTFVDGARLDEEITVTSGATIQIADFKIVIKSLTVSGIRGFTTAASSQQSSLSPNAVDETPPVVSVASLDEHSADYDLTDVAMAEEPELSDPEWNRDFDPWDSPDDGNLLEPVAQPMKPETSYERDAFSDDTAELLQAEVEFLRVELAERDAQLKELEEISTFDTNADSTDETITKDEAETLVGRLEQLLIELDERDEQVSTLSKLLRESEEAVDANDAERQQMETWIGEIERRVGQWQEEWSAEREGLEKTVADVTDQRDRAEHKLASGDSGDPSNMVRDELLDEIRQEYALLKSNFLAMEQERNQLQTQLEDSRIADVGQRVDNAVDAALREERLNLAQEKATIARVKSELTKKHEDLVSRLQRNPGDGDSADHRIRAFREHLREIHEHEPKQPRVATFSDRMGKLWRKLEGRPLDTD